MNKYYELDPNSPYFPYMQDTRVEMSKSEEEKDYIQRAVGSALISHQLETGKIPQDRWDYLMYCAMNDVPQEVGLKRILAEDFSEEEINQFKF